MLATECSEHNKKLRKAIGQQLVGDTHISGPWMPRVMLDLGSDPIDCVPHFTDVLSIAIDDSVAQFF